jgi:hypothetical protein
MKKTLLGLALTAIAVMNVSAATTVSNLTVNIASPYLPGSTVSGPSGMVQATAVNGTFKMIYICAQTQGAFPSNCIFPVQTGSVVTLTGLSVPGKNFAGFSSNCVKTGYNTCSLTLGSDTTVSATYLPILK